MGIFDRRKEADKEKLEYLTPSIGETLELS